MRERRVAAVVGGVSPTAAFLPRRPSRAKRGLIGCHATAAVPPLLQCRRCSATGAPRCRPPSAPASAGARTPPQRHATRASAAPRRAPAGEGSCCLQVGGVWLVSLPPTHGDVAQLVRVPDCRSGGCGFDSRRPRQQEAQRQPRLPLGFVLSRRARPFLEKPSPPERLRRARPATTSGGSAAEIRQHRGSIPAGTTTRPIAWLLMGNIADLPARRPGRRSTWRSQSPPQA